MPVTTDLLQLAINGDALGFQTAFNDELENRVHDKISDAYETVARNIYGEEDDSDDVGEDEFEGSDEIDIDEFEDDIDLDIDLEDLDEDD